MKNFKKGGRPTKNLTEKKRYNITIKMNTDEFYELKIKANKACVNNSDFIRKCISDSIIKKRIDIEEMSILRQLIGMANNLNQIAHCANISGYDSVSNTNRYLTKQIQLLIQKIKL